MTTPAQTRLAAFALVGGGTLCAAVVAPAVEAMAQAPHRPAAWFAAPEPLHLSADAARAAPSESYRPADANTVPSNWLDSTPAPKAAPRVSPAPRGPQQLPPSDWQQFKSWVGGKGDAVKKAVTPEPGPQPPARVNSTIPSAWTGGQPLPQTPGPQQPQSAPRTNSTVPGAWAGGQPNTPQPRPRAEPPPQPAAANSTVPPAWGGAPQQPARLPPAPTTYAGNPAYRWYGWGTVTPGANPYAPAGVYPQASGQWYAQTGATPGAFPVPAVNAFRPPPGPEPPAYVGQPVKVSVPAVGQPQFAPPARTHAPPPAAPKPIAQTPAPVFAPPGGPTPPAMPQSWRPPGILSEAKPGPAVVEPKWQPAAATVPVTRGQMPDDFDDIEKRVRLTCEGLVRNVSVRRDGNAVAIAFDATSETLADIAARAVSTIPELKPLTVTFDARLAPQ